MRYSSDHSERNGLPVVVLEDVEAAVRLTIAPSLGNRVIGLECGGAEFLYWRPGDFSGMPFMAPWANRMSADGFTAHGRRHPFGAPLALSRDANGLPIHGLLTESTLWRTVRLESGPEGAVFTSTLDFAHYPELLANWPFRHSLQLTFRVSDGIVEVELTVTNQYSEAMPLAHGFHPYFILPGTSRAETFVAVPARSRVVADARLIPTGSLEPISLPDRACLAEYTFDDGFTDLTRDADGKARFRIAGGDSSIEVAFGPRYTVAIVYAPPGHDYICIEPMTAITDGINLNASGRYPGLQWVQAGETWRESFWISVSRR